MKQSLMLLVGFLALPFVLLLTGVVLAVWSGFFVTRAKRVIEDDDRFYLDRALGDITPLIVGLAGIILVIWAGINMGVLPASVVATAVVSLFLLRTVHYRFIKLQHYAWENYLNPIDGMPGRPRGERYRFHYPVPDLTEKELEHAASNQDPELIYLYKVFRKHKCWDTLRAEIGQCCCHLFRRSLLYRTTGQLADDMTCDSWQQFGLDGCSPERIWGDLASATEFADFAQRWNFYALLITRQTVTKCHRLLFSPLTHAAAFLLAILVYFHFSPQMPGLVHQLQGVLFGISFLSSVVFVVVALMLYVYGKILALDRLPSPVPSMGDPFFEATSRVALAVSGGTAFTLGLGIPLSLVGSGVPTNQSAVVAGLTTAAIFFVSVWGTHFAMDNTKTTALHKITVSLNEATDQHTMTRLLHRYQEVDRLRVWPVTAVVLANALVAAAIPMVLQLLLKVLLG